MCLRINRINKKKEARGSFWKQPFSILSEEDMILMEQTNTRQHERRTWKKGVTPAKSSSEIGRILTVSVIIATEKGTKQEPWKMMPENLKLDYALSDVPG